MRSQSHSVKIPKHLLWWLEAVAEWSGKAVGGIGGKTIQQERSFCKGHV